MPGHDARHTYSIPARLPLDLDQVWNTTLLGAIRSEPAVAYGRVFVIAGSGTVYSLDDDTGEHRWNRSVSFNPLGITVYNDTVFVAAESALVALDAATGEERWTANMPAPTLMSPTVKDGRLLIASLGGTVQALSPSTGEPVWSGQPGGGFDIIAPIAADGGRIILAPIMTPLTCLNASTGGQLWQASSNLFPISAPTIDNTTVYVTSENGIVQAFDLIDGSAVWSSSVGGSIKGSAVPYGERVFVGSTSNKVFALSRSTGEVVWSRSFTDDVETSPVISSGRLYVADEAGIISVLDPETGDMLANVTLGATYLAPMAIQGGRLYVGSSSGTMFALGLGVRTELLRPELPRGAVASAANLTLGGTYADGSFPVNITLDVGSDDDPEWSFTGPLGTHVLSDGSTNGTVTFADGGGTDTSLAVRLPLGAVVTSASLVIAGEDTTSHPTNPVLDVGGDGDADWSSTGTFTTNATVQGAALVTELQELLDNGPVDHTDAHGNRYTDIPLSLSLASAGKLHITSVRIAANLTTPDIADEINGAISSCEVTPCSTSILITYAGGGAVAVGALSVTYARPDIEVIDVTASNATPGAGGIVTVNATIRNKGSLGASNVTVDLVDGDPGSGGMRKASSTIAELDAGADTTVSLAYNTTFLGGTHTIFIVADSDDRYGEADEKNNRLNTTVTITPPNPAITALSIADTTPANTPVTFNVTLRNTSPVPALHVPVEVLFAPTASTRARQDILIVSDDDISNHDGFGRTSVEELRSDLVGLGYMPDVWVESSQGRPTLTTLQSYGLVIWTVGDFYDDVIDAPDATMLIQYAGQGGRLLVTGANVPYDHPGTDFIHEVLHVHKGNWNTQISTIEPVSELGDHPLIMNVGKIAIDSFTEGQIVDDGYIDTLDWPGSGGEVATAVMRYSGSNLYALTAWDDPATDGGDAIYLGPVYRGLNPLGRITLLQNMLTWFGTTGMVVDSFVIPEVPPHSERMVIRTWTPANLAGNITLMAVADPEDLIVETNETDNNATALTRVLGADLIILSLTVDGTSTASNTNVTVRCTFANTGDADAVNASVLVTEGSLYSARIGNITLPLLEQGHNHTFALTWSIGNLNGDHTLTATADPFARVVEEDETNNRMARNITIAGPDLVVTDILLSEVSSSKRNVTLTLKNTGEGTATSVPARLTAIRTDRGYGGSTLSFTPVQAIAPNEDARVTATWNVAGHVGNYTLTAIVDPSDSIEEVNDTNNQLVSYAHFQGPDLIVTAIVVPPVITSPGTAINVTAVIHNRGPVDALGSRHRLMIVRDGGGASYSKNSNVRPLVPAGGDVTVWWSWTPGAVPGNYTLTVLADNYGNIEEENETNNILTTHTIIEGPDLVLLVPELPPVLANDRDRTIDVMVLNVGTANVTSSVEVMLTALSGTGGRVYIRNSTNGVGAGTSASVHLQLPASTFEGTYSLTFKVDPNDRIMETAESNNTVTRGVTFKNITMLEVPVPLGSTVRSAILNLTASPGEDGRYPHNVSILVDGRLVAWEMERPFETLTFDNDATTSGVSLGSVAWNASTTVRLPMAARLRNATMGIIGRMDPLVRYLDHSTTPSVPQGLAIDAIRSPEDQLLIVAVHGGGPQAMAGGIAIINTTTNTTRVINTGSTPSIPTTMVMHVYYHPPTQRIFAGSLAGLFIIDLARNVTTVLNPSTVPAIPDSEVLDVIYDEEHDRLFVGMDGGLAIINMTSNETTVLTTSTTPALADRTVWRLDYEPETQTLSMAHMRDRGVTMLRLLDNTTIHLTSSTVPELPAPAFDVAYDPGRDRLYVALVGSGLLIYDIASNETRFIGRTGSPALPSVSLFAVVHDRTRDRLLVGFEDGGFSTIDLGSDVIQSFTPGTVTGIRQQNSYSIWVDDSSDEVFVPSFNMGLLVLTPRGFPENVTVDVGCDGTQELSVQGKLETPAVLPTPALMGVLDEHIDTGQPAINATDASGNEYVDVPVNITSASGGMVSLHSLSVVHDITTTDLATAMEEYRRQCSQDPCPIPLHILYQGSGTVSVTGNDVRAEDVPDIRLSDLVIDVTREGDSDVVRVKGTLSEMTELNVTGNVPVTLFWDRSAKAFESVNGSLLEQGPVSVTFTVLNPGPGKWDVKLVADVENILEEWNEGNNAVSGKACIEDWSCSTWSSCNGGTLRRECTDNAACGTTFKRPSLTGKCSSPSSGSGSSSGSSSSSSSGGGSSSSSGGGGGGGYSSSKDNITIDCGPMMRIASGSKAAITCNFTQIEGVIEGLEVAVNGTRGVNATPARFDVPKLFHWIMEGERKVDYSYSRLQKLIIRVPRTCVPIDASLTVNATFNSSRGDPLENVTVVPIRVEVVKGECYDCGDDRCSGMENSTTCPQDCPVEPSAQTGNATGGAGNTTQEEVNGTDGVPGGDPAAVPGEPGNGTGQPSEGPVIEPDVIDEDLAAQVPENITMDEVQQNIVDALEEIEEISEGRSGRSNDPGTPGAPAELLEGVAPDIDSNEHFKRIEELERELVQIANDTSIDPHIAAVKVLQLRNELASLKRTTPTDVREVSSVRVDTKDASNEVAPGEMRALLDEVLAVSNPYSTSEEREWLAEYVASLNKKIGVITSTRVIDTTYLDGRTERRTVITKTILNKDSSTIKDVYIVISVPKDVASSASKGMVFTIGPTVVKDDPIVAWSLGVLEPGKAVEVTFSVPGEPLQESLDDIVTGLVSDVDLADSTVLVGRDVEIAGPGPLASVDVDPMAIVPWVLALVLISSGLAMVVMRVRSSGEDDGGIGELTGYARQLKEEGYDDATIMSCLQGGGYEPAIVSQAASMAGIASHPAPTEAQSHAAASAITVLPSSTMSEDFATALEKTAGSVGMSIDILNPISPTDSRLVIAVTPDESMSPSEVQAVLSMVTRGAVLLLLGRGQKDNQSLNKLSHYFGITFSSDVVFDNEDDNTTPSPFLSPSGHPLTAGIDGIRLVRSCSVHIEEGGEVVLCGGPRSFADPDGSGSYREELPYGAVPVMVARRMGRGSIVALGDADQFSVTSHTAALLLWNTLAWAQEPGVAQDSGRLT